ncbi:MAG: putative solute-binding protein [Pseudomonadota bacterium]
MKRAVACLGQILLCLGLSTSLAHANSKPLVICTWDILGQQGDATNMMKDYVLAAKAWGVNIISKSYTNEGIAADDFKASQCDGALITGLRARSFNKFTGSIDSVGSIPSYTHMRDVIDLLASPKLSRLLVSEPYEVVGAIPIGAAYAFVNDRSINNLAKAAGKKIAVLDWDKSQAEMVKIVGAVPVAADLTSYGGKFNNGQVDILFAPIPLYKPMELYKGLGSKGGIARFPVINLTLQLVIRKERFPPDFGLRSRRYIADQVPRFFGMIRNMEREVEPRHWMHIPLSDRDGYEKIMREMRIHLTKSGYYDPRMMTLLKRVRCRREPDAAECSLNEE